MTSNIRIDKVCQHCGNEFEARKTTTRTCSDACAKKLYKAKQRAIKIQESTPLAKPIKHKSMDDLNEKEFLTVRDVAKLLQCSLRTTYYLIEKGSIKAVNLSKRKTLIKRSEIDKLFA